MYIKKSSPVFFVEFIYLMFNGFLFLILKICWMALVIPLVWCYAIYGFFFFFFRKKKKKQILAPTGGGRSDLN